MIDISFVIVSWNAKKYLIECLNSIEKETRGLQHEIIVVDNGSSDGSVEILKHSFPQVSLICNDNNLGFAKANNIGIQNCHGRYVFLINSDVILLDGCIDTMTHFMDIHSSIGILGPRIFNPDLTKQNSCKYFPTLVNEFLRAFAIDALFTNTRFNSYFKPFFSPDIVTKVDILSGCFLMVRKKAFDKVGLFDERFFIYAEDKDLCKRFKKCGWEVMYTPDAQAIHYGGASSANAPTRFYIEMQRANLQYWEKHYKRVGYYIYWIILCLYHMNRIFGYHIARVVRRIVGDTYRRKIERSVASLRWLLANNRKEYGASYPKV